MSKYTDSLRGYSFEVMKRDDFNCRYCGLDGRISFDLWLSMSRDHLLPKEHPERENPNYIVTACKFCNTADNMYFKHAKKRGLKFEGLSQNQLVKQRLSYVNSTRDEYLKFWNEKVRET